MELLIGDIDGKVLGFNAKTKEVVDMFETNIIDPALVTKNAVRNAISVAGTVLTTEIAITMPKLPEQKVESK